MPDLATWNQAWARLKVDAPVTGVFDQLTAAYSAPDRKYHTLRHLDECFAKLEEIRPETEHLGEIEIALWFHDAIYDTKRQNNELKSAEWARNTALARNVPIDAAERIYKLIIATRHDAEPLERDEQVLVDVDLSILGAAQSRFDEYEAQVREEYAWVPEMIFRKKRREILSSLLARPSIFNTRKFIETYEARARQNLERSLRRLGG